MIAPDALYHDPAAVAPLTPSPWPAELRARIKAELAPGERLLWASRSGPKPAAAKILSEPTRIITRNPSDGHRDRAPEYVPEVA